MRLSACITTRNRTQELNSCLRALWDSQVKPHSVVVSDASPEREVQQKNCQIVEQYPGTTYIIGPLYNPCANRNNALKAILESEPDLIAFIDDDIYVEADFTARALDRYNQMSLQQRNRTILSGVNVDPSGHEIGATKLSFRGYYCSTDSPEVVNLHAAIFPRSLFKEEQWDENLGFGYEDAEFSLRALKRGYQILYCPEMRVFDAGANKSTLAVPHIGDLTEYEIRVAAGRLYVGIKRYKYLFPNPFKLAAFIILYFIYTTFFLLKRGSLKAWHEIIFYSKILSLKGSQE